jgi:hypothetical protein
MSYRGQSHGENVQVLAGDILRNQARGGLQSLPPQVLTFVKMAALNGTCAPVPRIRTGASAVVVVLASSSPLSSWPDLFPTIVKMLGTA